MVSSEASPMEAEGRWDAFVFRALVLRNLLAKRLGKFRAFWIAS